jgi:16S rRNA processing protein RimM
MTGSRDSGLGVRNSGLDRRSVQTNPEPRIPSPDWESMVLVGRIARPHGIRGQVIVAPDTDFVEERFRAGAVLWTRSERGDEMLKVGSARLQNGRAVIQFEGFSSIEDVERLAGHELRVPEDALQPLAEGVYYVHDLVGCVVETTSGERVGEVKRVDGGAGASVLSVAGARGEVLVPLAADICTEIDVGNRRIRINPPEGLLELNQK